MTSNEPPRTPPGMLPIGQFSRFVGLSIRMLRYYDEHGVLSPARVDSDTGYRYYTVAQMYEGARIRELRDIGLPVAAIAAVVRSAGDADALARVLEAQRGQLVDDAARTERRLADIDRLIRSLAEASVTSSTTTLTRRTNPAHTIVALRTTIPTYADEGPLWGRLMPAAMAAGAQPTGAGVTYHDSEFRESDCDVEIWLQVVAPVALPAPLTCREVPAQDVAMTTLRGDYAGFGAAAMALAEAMVAEGLAEAGPMSSRYLVGPTQVPNPADWVTEICIPV
ncbi:MAG TPA: MerR family transcriptional regulator [Candidatus Limnocylindrales bacterium]|nr:MerR family transcriptional regulator [Candidatus Limnocylindrales bacterium]